MDARTTQTTLKIIFNNISSLHYIKYISDLVTHADQGDVVAVVKGGAVAHLGVDIDTHCTYSSKMSTVSLTVYLSSPVSVYFGRVAITD